MRAPSLDLRLLETFEAIYTEKSLTNAALKLSMSQPAVSQALTRMRGHFGDPLFVRTGSGMDATPRGKEVFISAGIILREARISLVAQPDFDPATSEREFVIATTDLGAAALLPPLIAAIRQRAPHARILSVNADAHDLLEDLAAGDVSLAIGNFPYLQCGIYRQGLYQEGYVLLARPEHAVSMGEITLEKFRQMPQVLVTADRSGHFHCEIERRLRAMIPPESFVGRISSYLVAPIVSTHNKLLLVVPQRVARLFSTLTSLVELPIPFDLPTYAVTQYWHSRFHRDPGTVWLRRLICELFSMEGVDGVNNTVTLVASESQDTDAG